MNKISKKYIFQCVIWFSMAVLFAIIVKEADEKERKMLSIGFVNGAILMTFPKNKI